MWNQIKWLWENMDARFHWRHILALVISVVTSALLLVNPALTQRLVDDVLMAQNPEPLLGILAVMLVVKLGREGARYFMIVTLEKNSQNVVYNLRMKLFAKLQYNDIRFFDQHRAGDLMTRMSADLDLSLIHISSPSSAMTALTSVSALKYISSEPRNTLSNSPIYVSIPFMIHSSSLSVRSCGPGRKNRGGSRRVRCPAPRASPRCAQS